MHPKALLDLTADLLRTVLKLTAPADMTVSHFFRQHKGLGMRERMALAETTYAVLRQRTLLQNLAQSGSGPLERRLAILGWGGDERFLRGALSPIEQAWLDNCQTIDRQNLSAAQRHNLPDWLAQALQAQAGESFWSLAESLMQPAPLDVRVNILKTDRAAVQQSLLAAGLEALSTPYSPWGLRLKDKPAINKLAAFLDGEIEVQDEGSQLLALLTQAKRGEMVVDFCAGAGGKTLALGGLMRNTGRLYALDVSAHRLAALKPRLARSGLSNVYPMQIAHERDERIKRLRGKIDRVLVDAPCSGLGTLRRNPDLKWRQTPQSIQELNVKQTAILEAAGKLLKPGGQLIYATCSLLQEENETIAQAFTDAHQKDFQPVAVSSILEKLGLGEYNLADQGYLRLWPHSHAVDGFFAAVWQRQ